MITIPENFISDLLPVMSEMFSEFKNSLLFILIIGFPLGFWVIGKIIDLFFDFIEEEEKEEEDDDEFFYGERKRRLRS